MSLRGGRTFVSVLDWQDPRKRVPFGITMKLGVSMPSIRAKTHPTSSENESGR